MDPLRARWSSALLVLALALALTLALACGGGGGSTEFSARSSLVLAKGVYGPAIQADSLVNTVLGGSYNTRTAYRFRCDHDGILQGIRFYLVKNTTSSGYSGGTGGTVQVELHPDDGSALHAPGAEVLAALTLTNPLDAGFYPARTFAKPSHLKEGTLYHLVFWNSDPHPDTNYISVNSLFLRKATLPLQAWCPDSDWGQLLAWSGGGGVWHPRDNMGLGNGFTPILELDYEDGHVAGMGYVGAWVVASTVGGTAKGGPKSITGTSAVRQVFTVSGPDRRATGVSVRLARVSGSSALSLSLEASDGAILEQGTVPASALGSDHAYVSWTFTQEHILEFGHGFHLVLRTSADTEYRIYPIQKGKDPSIGFSPGTYWNDGHVEWTSNGQNWQNWDQWGGGDPYESGDLQFYVQADKMP